VEVRSTDDPLLVFQSLTNGELDFAQIQHSKIRAGLNFGDILKSGAGTDVCMLGGILAIIAVAFCISLYATQKYWTPKKPTVFVPGLIHR
jgi:hypothetical protein